MPQPLSKPGAATHEYRHWHPYASSRSDNVVLEELAATLKETTDGHEPTKAELQMRLGELRALIRDAEHGRLDDERWKGINRDPRLWELRLAWNGTEHSDRGAVILVRAYFIEPDDYPDKTVVMLFHRKDTSGTQHKINKTQDEFIKTASKRLDIGRNSHWGLDWTKPIFP